MHHRPPRLNPAFIDLLIALAAGPLSAQETLDAMAEWNSRRQPLGTLYRHLAQGVDAGWIEIEEAALDGDKPGRPTRRYRLTANGTREARAAARRSLGMLERYRSVESRWAESRWKPTP